MIFLLVEDKKDGEGEGGKYLEKDNVRDGKYIFLWSRRKPEKKKD